ncbi:hypothetical protein [Methylobacterium sp. Leaf125]|uniref:hypothetical protein n=1 Tax=Methylobacterium sp. Leaf125 TaxID=1736265 RepID=UPI001FCDE8CC|nr:hypothetical protein [Methylobacterium sp. Leaf125]
MHPLDLIDPARGRSALRLAGALAVIVGLALSGPGFAQSVGSSIDQPTPGTLPSGTSTTKGSDAARHQGTGGVAPPSAIQSSTDVMQSEGSVQGKDHGGRTTPIQHLPKDMR